MTEKLYTNQDDPREVWRKRLLERHSNQLSMQEVSNLATDIDSDLRARLGLLLQQVAGHQMHLMFGVADGRIVKASCACGVEFDATKPQCPQWEQHILSLSPDLDKALEEHDAEVQRQAIISYVEQSKVFDERSPAETVTNSLPSRSSREGDVQSGSPQVSPQSELDAAIAAAYEDAAQHWPTIGYCFSLYTLECSCGKRLVDSWKHVDREKFKAAWQEHLCSRTPADALRAQQERDADITADLKAEIVGLRESYRKLEADNAALRAVVREIQEVASGEKQVAMDDTEGMEWIDKKARRSAGRASENLVTTPRSIVLIPGAQPPKPQQAHQCH